mmetsp:Transcript_11495/g.40104  ORF Transcript_11495/g.40104 Transcript_11495/m.40104 type:complete len:216 (+) Transcript_11495:1029-1676(+)
MTAEWMAPSQPPLVKVRVLLAPSAECGNGGAAAPPTAHCTVEVAVSLSVVHVTAISAGERVGDSMICSGVVGVSQHGSLQMGMMTEHSPSGIGHASEPTFLNTHGSASTRSFTTASQIFSSVDELANSLAQTTASRMLTSSCMSVVFFATCCSVPTISWHVGQLMPLPSARAPRAGIASTTSAPPARRMAPSCVFGTASAPTAATPRTNKAASTA